jgi:UDP-N-acetylglucosamine pyrophosphorylase
MRAAGIATPTITAFIQAVGSLRRGEGGHILETEIEPLPHLPRAEHIAAHYEITGETRASLLRQLVVVKLNGGLGTSMGLDRARSLLVVKDGDSFLDFIARQILHLRSTTNGNEPAFYLMNSFATQRDTLGFLGRYPALAADGPLDFLQNMVPKLDHATLAPVSWPVEPELEWCPPGHGDIFPALLGAGLLDALLERGVRFMFVSNSDNLGATVDLGLLSHFADEGLSFLMEVAERTFMDRKGGHLARSRSTGRLMLREAAQCAAQDTEAFQDIARHRFFNTNNLWVRLDHLKAAMEQHQGALPLPVIPNAKSLDPRDRTTPRVLQIESAMGAAIECFDRSGAIVVPRTRFAPVKNTADLLVLRSDACRVTEDHRLVLDERRGGQPPIVTLDPDYYQVIEKFEGLFATALPSLIGCTSLEIKGPVSFAEGVICEGDVRFVNSTGTVAMLVPGTYADATIEL